MARQIEEIILKVSVDDRRAQTELKGLHKDLDKAENSARGLSKGFKLISGALALSVLQQLASEAVDIAVQFDKVNNSLKSVLGSQTAVNAEMSFLSKISDELGLSLLSTADAYAKVAAASKGTSLEGQGARDILQGVSEASTALGLSADQTSGALTAINQIISKGKVQAEELRGQLGERIPGAFQIAARAMGKTTQELDKMLEQGQLLSEDFIPKFAKQLRTEFAGAAIEAADSIQANMNRLRNEWEKTLVSMGQKVGELAPAFTRLLRNTREFAIAVDETLTGLNMYADDLLGVADASADVNHEALHYIKLGEQARALREKETEAIDKQVTSLTQLNETLKQFNAFNELGMKFNMADDLERVQEALDVSDTVFNQMSGSIAKALSKGASFADVIEQSQRFIKTFGKDLKEVADAEDFKAMSQAWDDWSDTIDGVPIDELIKKQKELSDKRQADLLKAQEERQQRIEENFNLSRESPTVESSFQLGTAAASEFLQGTKLNEERNKLLKDIREAAKKRANQPPVKVVTKGSGL